MVISYDYFKFIDPDYFEVKLVVVHWKMGALLLAAFCQLLDQGLHFEVVVVQKYQVHAHLRPGQSLATQ